MLARCSSSSPPVERLYCPGWQPIIGGSCLSPVFAKTFGCSFFLPIVEETRKFACNKCHFCLSALYARGMARSRELPKELQSLLHEYHLEMESAKRAIEEEYAEATDDARVKLHDHLESAVTTLGYLAREALSETVRARAAMFIVDKFIDQGAPNPEDPMQKLAEKLTKSGSAG
jgi:hypothetical protein